MTTERDLQRTDIDPFAKRPTVEERGDAFAREDGVGTDLMPETRPTATAAFGTDANAVVASAGDSRPALLDGHEADGFRSRWEQCQRHFVDEPEASVRSADELVAEVMQSVTQRFGATREGLEQQWDRGDSVSTEDLRLAMQKYREFFNRQLAA